MTTHLRTRGLSRRAYARLRGCSESAVRQAIADGRLKPALYADGSIDAGKADDLLAQSTIGGKEPPSELTEARQRKLRAQCALLRDEIEALESSLIPPAEAEEAMRSSCLHVAARLRTMMEEVLPAVVMVEAIAASAAVQAATYATLEALSKTKVLPATAAKPEGRERSLAKMTGTELAALKVSLQAHRMELQSEQREQALLRLDDYSRQIVTRFTSVRTKLLSLHHRAAPQLRMVDQAEARRVLGSLVDEAIEVLAGPMVPIAMLLPDRERSSGRRRKAA